MTESRHAIDAPLQGEALDLARALVRRGRLREARALLDETLAQPSLQRPATVDLAAKVGWLALERGGLCLDGGEIEQANVDARFALGLFEAAQHRAGAGFAALLAGDIAAAAGGQAAAARWWQSALALGDAAGNGALAARALCALLVSGAADLAGLDLAGVAAAARARLQAPVAAALAQDDVGAAAARAQGDVAEATLALCATRDALRGGRLAEARLTLPAVLEVAQRLATPGLLVDALRLDAALARREGDARAAVESGQRALAVAERAGLRRLAAVVRSEVVFALADDERWAEAFELAAADQRDDEADGGALAALPAVAGARLEAFAMLSLRAQKPSVAREAIGRARALREAVGDHAARARCDALACEIALGDGDVAAALALAEGLVDDDDAPPDARVAGALCVGLALGTRGRGRAAAAAALARFDAVAALVDGASLPARVAHALARADALATLALADEGARVDGDGSDGGDGGRAARDAIARARQLAARAPMRRTAARVDAAEAALALRLDGPARALELGQKALATAAEAADRRARAEALITVGAALAQLGRVDEAALALGHGHDEAAGIASGTLAAEALIGHAELARRSGDPRRAVALFERARGAARRRGSVQLLARAARGLALVALGVGEDDAARAQLTHVVTIGDAEEGALAALDLARLDLVAARAAGRAQAEAAAAAIVDAHADDAGSGPAVGVARALLVAEALAALGRHDDAKARLEPWRERAGRLDIAPYGALLLMLGQLQIATGEGEAGGATLAEALSVAARVGAREANVVHEVIERLRADAEPRA